MRQLQLIANGEPSDVVELNTVSEPALGQEDVLNSMERPRSIHQTFCLSAVIERRARFAFASACSAELLSDAA